MMRNVLQQLIGLVVAAVLGAERHERSIDHLSYCNGCLSRLLTTKSGNIDLKIPKFRSGRKCVRSSSSACTWVRPSMAS